MDQNTIKHLSISGEEYVIIKNLKKDYDRQKIIIIKKILEEIKKNYLK